MQSVFINKVIFSKSLLHIGNRTYFDCENLEEVIFERTKSSIDKEAFKKMKLIIEISVIKVVILYKTNAH